MKKHKFVKMLLVSIVAMVILTAASSPTIGCIIESINIDEFPLIDVRLSVWDTSGNALTNLSSSDFQIVENKGAPIQPIQVKLDNDAPLTVALVLDVSVSMQGQPLKDAQIAAARFLDRLGPNDQVALIAFSQNVDPDPQNLKANKEYPFTHEFKGIYDAIERLEAEGGTELYNALQKAILMTSKLPEGHRAVLLLSDGVNDPVNVGDPAIPIQMAQEMNVPVFIIGLGYNFDKAYLERLASESGGLVRITPRSSELAQTFDDIAKLLKTQYVLTYKSNLTSADSEVETVLTVTKSGNSVDKSIQINGLVEKIAAMNMDQTQQSLNAVLAIPVITEIAVLQPTSQPTSVPGEVSLAEKVSPILQLMKKYWLWLGFIGLIAALVFLNSRRKKKQTVYCCARCGYKIHENVGTCPQCGETRKIKS
jgi:VWFA-related protein